MVAQQVVRLPDGVTAGAVIGKGGCNVKQMRARTRAAFLVDDEQVVVWASSKAAMQRGVAALRELFDQLLTPGGLIASESLPSHPGLPRAPPPLRCAPDLQGPPPGGPRTRATCWSAPLARSRTRWRWCPQAVRPLAQQRFCPRCSPQCPPRTEHPPTPRPHPLPADEVARATGKPQPLFCLVPAGSGAAAAGGAVDELASALAGARLEQARRHGARRRPLTHPLLDRRAAVPAAPAHLAQHLLRTAAAGRRQPLLPGGLARRPAAGGGAAGGGGRGGRRPPACL
jgi:hypothetical protein